jgi:hypothetical protein
VKWLERLVAGERRVLEAVDGLGLQPGDQTRAARPCEEIAMSETIREIIERDAAALQSPLSPARFGTRTLSDGVYAADFFDRRYEPSVSSGQRVPGLRDAGLPATRGQEIRLIVEDVGELNRLLRAGGAAYPAAPLRTLVTRGHALLRWRRRAEPALAPQVRELVRNNGNLQRSGPLAIALSDVLRVARADADRPRALQGLDPAFFDGAETTMRAFRAWQPPDLTPAYTRRTRLATLLQARVSEIVETADVAFHQFPHIKREARSEERRSVAAAAARTRRERRVKPSDEPATSTVT